MKKTSQESNGIINCPISKLEEICAHYLTVFDDYQQLFHDLNKPKLVDYFVKAYDQLEAFYFQIKTGIEPGEHRRNEIRLLLKYAQKHAHFNLLEKAS